MAIAFIASVLQYLQLFTGTTRLTIQGMTPAWILPVFPILFGAVLASIIASDQPPIDAFTIVICGLTYLGLGWMVAILMTAIYLRRLMEFGLPAPDLRPGMFIAVGPPTFTGAALIGLSNSLTIAADQRYFVENYQAIKILQTVATFTAIFLWALGFWFFCLSLIAVLCGVKKMEFHLVWWASVFPNVAFALATARIGDQLESEGIMWVASAMTILLVAAWLFVIAANTRAFLLRKITMPGKDEDRGERTT
jgi:tellurite resistance protein TehA-like permease